MISVLTSYRVTPGQETAFEAAFADLQQRVVGREPGTVAFQLYRDAGNRRHYKVIAHFRDDASRKSHNDGAYLRAAAKRLFAVCDEPPHEEIFRAV